MREKKKKVINGINEFVREISIREGVDKIIILQGLINDLSLGKGQSKKYPHIKYPAIDGGVERIKQILEQCLDDVQREKNGIINNDYYKDVQRYTQNFEFLIGSRDITFASSGHRTMKNSEYVNRFENFVNLLRLSAEDEQSEEELIEMVLAGKNKLKITDLIDRKILEARLGFIREERKREASKKRESRAILLRDGR